MTTIHSYITYDPVTGLFLWLPRNNPKFDNRFAGKQAGTVDPKTNYRYIMVNRIRYLEHRLAFLLMLGKLPINEVDHINHNRSDNRWSNLRLVTRTENGRNCSRSKNNTSGITGVVWDISNNCWRPNIKVNGVLINLKSTIDFFEAICLRKSAEVKYNFHPNHGK